MLALVAERGSRRMKTPVHLLSVLPIITPPFVVGLGLILLFGRAGIVNQVLESAFGVTPTRWFYGLPGLWLAQLFAFTPIACLIMRGVVAGISPSLEEAAQTLRADRWTTFRTVTLPLLKPGSPTPSWSASSRASPTSATRSSSAASTACSRPRSSSRSSVPSSTRAVRPRWRSCFGIRARRLPAAAEGRRPGRLHHRLGKGRRRRADAPARGPVAGDAGDRAALARVHDRRLPVRLRRRLRRDLGPRLHADPAPLRHRLRPAVGGRKRRRRPGLGRHGLELADSRPSSSLRWPRRSAPGSAS